MDLNTYLSLPDAPSASALARKLSVSPDQIRQWRHAYAGRRPNDDSCAQIEKETQGQCTCEELNPTLKWARIPDKSWKWHPKGRPVVDPTRDAKPRKTEKA